MNTKLPQRTVIRAAAGLCLAAGLATAQGTDCTNCTKGCEQSGSAAHEQEVEILVHPTATPSSHVVRTDGHAFVVSPVVGVGQPAQPESRVETRMVMIQNDGEHEYKVELNNDDAKAWVDGKKVPANRLKVTSKVIKILDEDGDTLMEFQRSAQVYGEGEHEVIIRGQKGDGDGPITWQSGGGDDNTMVLQLAQPEAHPPVMIGITMGPVDSDAAGELDLDEDEGITVMGVIDGLPAQEAGLREGDVIIAVEGKHGAGQEKLRDILNDKKPGDTLTLTISRKGKEKQIKVELQAYDVSKLGSMSGVAPSPSFELNLGGAEQQGIQQLIEKLRKQGNGMDENTRKDIEELLRNLQAHQLQGMDSMPRMWFYQDSPGAPSAPRALVNPVPGDRAGRETTQRLDRLENRLDRLESRIDRLIELLDSRENKERNDN